MKTLAASTFFLSLILTTVAFGQSGGSFRIEKSVIANGGGRSSGGAFTLDATAGESVAGTASAGGSFSLASGFWAAASAAASTVSVAGRVLTPDGLGLKNANVAITDQNGVAVRVTTTGFGFYSFSNVKPGGSYLIAVTSKRFRFSTKTIIINDNLTGVDFTGIE